jgi:hypothetical protein
MAKSKTGENVALALAWLAVLSVIVGAGVAIVMLAQRMLVPALLVLAQGVVGAVLLLALKAIIELLREISGAAGAKGSGLPATP